MRKYRIVTDGIRYRIQCFKHRWWRRDNWINMGRFHPDVGWSVLNLYTIEEAKEVIRSTKDEDKAKEQGYKVVESEI